MVVQRRGGTVTLAAVTEAIQKVQVGTDRTAAELALIRLEKELGAARATEARLLVSLQIAHQKVRQTSDGHWGHALVAILGFFMTWSYADYVRRGGDQVENALMGLAAVALVWVAWKFDWTGSRDAKTRRNAEGQRATTELEKLLRGAQVEIERLNQEAYRNRMIVAGKQP
ncbi:MAG TPA: hypothetical protein PLZ95_16515 [Bryobacteraceae bacterium]|nr:hypothetical protein [Bryobacteraceae bacterium]